MSLTSTTPLEVATSFLEAFATRSVSDASRWVAADVTFTSPRIEVAGRDAYLSVVTEFSELVTGLDLVCAMGDDERAVLIYDMHTTPFGAVRVADLYEVRQGLIIHNNLLFDSAALSASVDVDASS